MENGARCLAAARTGFAKNRSDYWALDSQSVEAPQRGVEPRMGDWLRGRRGGC